MLANDWHGSIYQRFAKGFVSKNLWRVRYSVGSYEDSMSEAVLVYVNCCAHYQLQPCNNGKRFMAYYKTALRNRWNKLSLDDTYARVDDGVIPESHTAVVTENPEPVMTMWVSASQELKQVLTIIANAPAEMLGILFPDDEVKNEHLAATELGAWLASREEIGRSRCLQRLSGVRLAENNVLAELRSLTKV